MSAPVATTKIATKWWALVRGKDTFVGGSDIGNAEDIARIKARNARGSSAQPQDRRQARPDLR
jgi:hypothetical protein